MLEHTKILLIVLLLKLLLELFLIELLLYTITKKKKIKQVATTVRTMYKRIIDFF